MTHRSGLLVLAAFCAACAGSGDADAAAAGVEAPGATMDTAAPAVPTASSQEVLETTGDALRLRLQLVDGPHEESYVPAEVPYVCPEMAR